MNAKNALATAAILVVAAVIGIAALLVPPGAWSAAAVCAVVLAALAAGLVLFGSELLPRGARRGGDAAMIAAIGPMGLLVVAYLAWSVLTFIVALQGFETIGWAMIVAGLAGAVAGRLMLHAALASVDDAASGTSSAGARARWMEALRSAATSASESHRPRIEKLMDTLDFGPSEPAGSQPPINAQITEALAGLAPAMQGDAAELSKVLAQVENLLATRTAQLRQLRDKSK